MNIILVVVLIFLGNRNTYSQIPTEYEVKAAFLFNFAKFIEWPDTTFNNREEPVIIGVLGRNPFGVELEQTFEKKSIKGRNIIIEYYNWDDVFEQCHILFICVSEKRNWTRILNRLRDRAVLTVSESKGFVKNGGMINFVIRNNKVKFQINNLATRVSGLRVSAKLLKVAIEVVNGES